MKGLWPELCDTWAPDVGEQDQLGLYMISPPGGGKKVWWKG